MTHTSQRTRALVFGFGLVVVLILGVLSVGLLHIQQSRHILDETVVEHNGCIDLSSQMYRISRERMVLLQQIAEERDSFARDELISRFHELAGEFAKTRTALLKRDLGQEELQILDQQARHAKRIIPLQEETIDRSLKGDRNAAQESLIKQILPAHSQMLALLVDFGNLQTAEMRQAIEETRQSDSRALGQLLLTGSASIVLTIFIATFVHRRITNLTGKLANTVETLNASLRELEYQKLALDEHAIVNAANAKGEIQYVNDRLCTISQYKREELLGQKHTILNSGFHPDSFFAELWQTITAGHVWHGQIRNRRKDGRVYWADTTIVPFLDESGKPYQFVAVQTDITAAKEAEAVLARGKEELEALVAERTADLQERQALLQKITTAAQDAIIMIDDTDCITFWNEAAEEIFGYAANEIIGRKLHDLLMPPRHRGQYEAAFAQFTRTGQGNFVGQRREVAALRHDGTEFPLEISLSAVKIKERWTAIGIARDITERKKAEATLQQLATSDPLTGIANRRHLDTEMELEIRRAERYHLPLSLVIFDVDHFKSINDAHGHQTGDRVLIELTTLVAGSIRTNDLFARWGGEEFAILANNCEAQVAGLFSEKLRSLIGDFRFHETGRVTCSFGVTAFRPGESMKEFVARADKALYLAKTGGRNRVETL